MDTRIRIREFGEVEERVRTQLLRCTEDPSATAAVLCADNHLGYSQPVGAAIAYRGKISPSGVGYDIGCGNKAVKTTKRADDIGVPFAMAEIAAYISFGVGRNNKTAIDHPVLSKIAGSPLEEIRKMGWFAAGQLGTVGSGNHYVDLFRDEEGWLWVGVHFGSRGFGHRIATGFLNLAHNLPFEIPRGPEGRRLRRGAPADSMDAAPTLLDDRSALGQDYLHAMTLAGEYAYAGRDWVTKRVLDILDAEIVEEVHNHHNFAWAEEHDGEQVWVIRKGCTPAFPGQKCFVGGSMGDNAVILEGVDGEEAREALYSTIHGAGRVMSRTQAAGKRTWIQGRMVRVGGGLIDWDAARRDLKDRGIVLVGGGADEAPGVYKRLATVLRYHTRSVRVLHTLEPIGVAMAGEEIEDPYRD